MKSNHFTKKCAFLLKQLIEKKTTLKTACYATDNPGRYYKVLYHCLKDTTHTNNKIEYKKCIEKIKSFKVKNENEKQPIKYIRINTLKDINLNLEMEETAVKDVYILKNRIEYGSDFIRNHNIVLQNISSCIPAFILNPPLNSVVIDTCAAPGNKTTHLAAIMKNTGKIYAVEKDIKRFKILENTVENSGAKNIKIINSDFCTIDPMQFADVRFALVDPSCSGSGIHEIYEKDAERLKKLQKFQLAILKHVANFKGVEKIVYSTCSIHEEENEEVIDMFLKENVNFITEKIQLIGFNKGLKNYKFCDDVLRVEKGAKGAIGFFAALLRRK